MNIVRVRRLHSERHQPHRPPRNQNRSLEVIYRRSLRDGKRSSINSRRGCVPSNRPRKKSMRTWTLLCGITARVRASRCRQIFGLNKSRRDWRASWKGVTPRIPHPYAPSRHHVRPRRAHLSRSRESQQGTDRNSPSRPLLTKPRQQSPRAAMEVMTSVNDLHTRMNMDTAATPSTHR